MRILTGICSKWKTMLILLLNWEQREQKLLTDFLVFVDRTGTSNRENFFLCSGFSHKNLVHQLLRNNQSHDHWHDVATDRLVRLCSVKCKDVQSILDKRDENIALHQLHWDNSIRHRIACTDCHTAIVRNHFHRCWSYRWRFHGNRWTHRTMLENEEVRRAFHTCLSVLARYYCSANTWRLVCRWEPMSIRGDVCAEDYSCRCCSRLVCRDNQQNCLLNDVWKGRPCHKRIVLASSSYTRLHQLEMNIAESMFVGQRKKALAMPNHSPVCLKRTIHKREGSMDCSVFWNEWQEMKSNKILRRNKDNQESWMCSLFDSTDKPSVLASIQED